MSDSFNPQELLSKLRAKSTNSTAASVSSSVAPEPQSHRQMERRNSGASEFEQRSSNTNRVQATKNIRAPVSLTLTPSQRQENLNSRLELEKEIKRLQDEVAALARENQQLKRDKEDVEQQFMDFRTKNEDIVVKLRGKIAAITLANQEGLPADRGAGAGKMYAPPHQSIKQMNANQLNLSSSRSPSAKGLNTPLSVHSQGHHAGFHDSEAKHHTHHAGAPGTGGFRDPTFSELMRRSTPEHVELRDALRRNGTQKLGTGLSSTIPQLTHHQGHHPHMQHQSHPHPHPGQHQPQHQNHFQGQQQGHTQGHPGQGYAQNQNHGQHMPPPPPAPHQQPPGYATNNANNMSHAQSHLLSPSVNSSNNNISGHHNQRTKSLPNVLNSFGDHRDLLSSGESKPSLAAHLQGDFNHHHHSRQGSNGSNVHPDGDHYYGSNNSSSGNNAHGGNNQSYHFAHNNNNTHHQPGGNNAQSHNIDYLSTADTSDGEDIPVLEIDLTN
eukprot:gene12611-14580_t